MFDLDRWQEIWITITRNKMRSFLTAFGVFWGIFMLVVMAGAGYGMQNSIISGFDGFAVNSAFFFTNRTSEAYKGFRKGRSWDFQNEDLSILKSQVKELQYISPMLLGGRRDNNTVRQDKYGSFHIKGLHYNYTKIDPLDILKGRFINEIDLEERRKVCVIGKKVYEDMFDVDENPIGQLIKVNGIYYSIIGVVEPVVTNVNIGGNNREAIILPYTVMQQTYNRGDVIDCIAITAYSNIPISDVEEKVKSILKQKHSIAPNDNQAVDDFNAEKMFKMISNVFTGVNVLIWIVGLGTLISGVVGVSNIMMVTVRERTKEIGIRRALGAKPLSILVQIMNESLLLTSLAGFFGLAAGVGLLSLVDMALGEQEKGQGFFLHPQIPFSMAVTAAVILLASGIIAGIIPSLRALQVKAIDAIREE